MVHEWKLSLYVGDDVVTMHCCENASFGNGHVTVMAWQVATLALNGAVARPLLLGQVPVIQRVLYGLLHYEFREKPPRCYFFAYAAVHFSG